MSPPLGGGAALSNILSCVTVLVLCVNLIKLEYTDYAALYQVLNLDFLGVILTPQQPPESGRALASWLDSGA